MNTILTPIKRAIILGCALLGMTQAVQTRVALSRHSGANAGRMQRFLAVRSLTGFLVAVLLASCGGGGGGGVGPGIPEISAGSPPPGENGVAYPGYTFTVASGGSPPFSWAVTSGALPTDLTLASNGSLSGTPTATDSFTFTVTVTDSAATPATNSKPFTIKVGEPPPTIISAQPPTAIEGVVYPPFTFTAGGGLAPLVWSETGPLPDLGVSLDGVLSGTPSGAGIFPISLDVKDALNRSAPSAPVTVRVALARPAMAFVPTGSMTIARVGHTATLLKNGKVLVTGGNGGSGPGLASAELYDPSNEFFTATGSMTIARVGHTATLLTDPALPNYGKVLIAGGDPSGTAAELYDPVTETFTATASMTIARVGHTATLLTDPALPNYGKVLIAGGGTATAELYDPANGTFTATGSMTTARVGHTATLLTGATLPNYGKVLIAGGATATAELYDPANGTFSATGGMTTARAGHTATLLTDPALPNYGKVLIAGSSSAEVFDPASGTFAAVGSLPAGGAVGCTATLRSDGTVLVAGGAVLVPLFRRLCLFTCHQLIGHALASQSFTELFAPESEGFIAMSILTRDGHTATLLADGSVLVAGGVYHSVNFVIDRDRGSVTVLSSAELFK